ncbi:hypothetical protein [Celeribacter marinus]|uniref:hypothetical protein n=1 Tax=Celeribacter marinus TaxID=1397108 RepID=UPI003F6D6C6C
MAHIDDSAPKSHYICQTYIETSAGAGQHTVLKIGKQFQYSKASEAQERAEREARNDDCAGADAYVVVEDPTSGEIGAPTFLVRIGNVPEFEDF